MLTINMYEYTTANQSTNQYSFDGTACLTFDKILVMNLRVVQKQRFHLSQNTSLQALGRDLAIELDLHFQSLWGWMKYIFYNTLPS